MECIKANNCIIDTIPQENVLVLVTAIPKLQLKSVLSLILFIQIRDPGSRRGEIIHKNV